MEPWSAVIQKAKVKCDDQENAGQEPTATEQRDPKKTLSTVPLPSNIADVVDAGMANFFATGRSGQACPAAQQSVD